MRSINRILFFSLCACALAAAGCGKTKIVPPPQDQPQCDAGKLDSAGLCVECTADADCAVGQTCNLITGTCQPAPQPTDAGPIVLTCQLGAVRCAPDGKAVQTCVTADGGNAWSDSTVCTGSQVCNPQTLTCAICIPGETTCDSPDSTAPYQRCKDDGTGWDPRDCGDPDAGGIAPGAFCHQVTPHQDLPDGGEPIAALATCRLCQPGSTQCTTQGDGGVGVLTCDSSGSEPTFHSCYPTNNCISDDGPAHCAPFICYPGQHRCTYADGGSEPNNVGTARQTCNGDGSAWTQDDCSSSQVCGPAGGDRGACLSPCDVAENSTSYVGCDYWGTLMSNTALDSRFTSEAGGLSEYAFVVGNSFSQAATVTVQSLGNNQTYSASVPANSVGTVKLPWLQICGTGQAKYGYHLTSTLPVTVYQFNPLSSALPAGGTCSGSGIGSCGIDPTKFCKSGQCYYGAFTDDASLLLPSHLLGTSYVVISQDHEALGSTQLPGSFSVVASEDDTRVQIHFSGGAVGSGAGQNAGLCQGVQGNIPLINPGQTVQFSMTKGDVLAFWSNQVGSPTCGTNGNGNICRYANDLTGSVVTSIAGSDGTAKKIAVFGGADCTFEPYTESACDHIEEEMFPFSTWGKSYVGEKSKKYSGATTNYPDYWRVVSGCGPTSCPNGTTITITPAIVNSSARPSPSCGANCTCTTSGAVTTCHLPPLGASDTAPWIEFQHGASFSAQSDQPFVLAQYFVGEDEAGTGSEGDPSLVLAPPVEQWRTSYTVLAPTSYQHNYANLMVLGQAATAAVSVDGTVVPAGEWSMVPNAAGGTALPFYVAQHPLSNSGSGSHTIVGANGTKVGVVVYGYDAYVSYGYTGGLDLQSITQINPGG